MSRGGLGNDEIAIVNIQLTGQHRIQWAKTTYWKLPHLCGSRWMVQRGREQDLQVNLVGA